jgi:hypothetical protein
MKTLIACTLAVAITCSLSAAETEKYIEKEFPTYMETALKTNKLLFISIGREACSNCVKFYDYIKDGSLKLDEKKFIYLKLDIDNQEHVDYFSSYFTVMGNVLPFVGVMNGSGATFGASRTGYGTAEDYQEFLKKALEDEKEWLKKEAQRAKEEAQLKAAQEARKKAQSK